MIQNTNKVSLDDDKAKRFFPYLNLKQNQGSRGNASQRGANRSLNVNFLALDHPRHNGQQVALYGGVTKKDAHIGSRGKRRLA